MQSKNFTAIIVAVLLCNSLFSQTAMFCGNAEHNATINSKPDITFGETAWKFNADAPIRSTVVCNKNVVYFGCSNGFFYALNKQTGNVIWKYYCGYAIESSPAFLNGNIFFSNNKQSLFSLNANTGKLNWKYDFDKSLSNDWGFDYYYSSPTISGNKIIIGAADGYVYNINSNDGKLVWKYKVGNIIRSSPAVSYSFVYFGDITGIMYAINLSDAKDIWRFNTTGNGLNNLDFGFDRRAIISSPTIINDKIIFGCRDGFFYCLNKATGKELWHVNHEVSWIISTIAVKDTFAVTGTSDGKFVQAVSLNTGKEIWKFKTISVVWSSPLIDNNKVYVTTNEGELYCLDLFSGKKINDYQAQGKIFSSPVINDSLLFFGTDKGILYALKPATYTYSSPQNIKRYVFWEENTDLFFHYGNDKKINFYLQAHHFQSLDTNALINLLKQKDSAAHSIIVFASNYFPQTICDGNKNSLLRQWLNAGGRIVVLGNNPALAKFDSSGEYAGYDFTRADSILNIHYGPNDLRSISGLQPGFPTDEGKNGE